jgi:FkbM family methyltransferase
MVSILSENQFRSALRPLMTHTIRTLPIPKGQKWALSGKIADRLESASSPRKIVRMAEGFKMSLDLSESYERRMYYSGLYATYLTRLFKRLVEPGDTVIDGGANIGYFSLLAAKRLGKHGTVHAFEPIPHTFEVLNENIRLNGFSNIHAKQRALTRNAGELRFEIPTDVYSGKSLGRLATTALLGSGSQLTVPACTLDEYAALSDINSIKLVKLDVEGSEVEAIAGMQHLLSYHRISYLICELATTLLDKMGISYSAMQAALKEHGYRCYYINCYIGYTRMEHLHLVAIPFEDKPVEPGDYLYGDYLFVAPGMPIPGTLNRRSDYKYLQALVAKK